MLPISPFRGTSIPTIENLVIEDDPSSWTQWSLFPPSFKKGHDGPEAAMTFTTFPPELRKKLERERELLTQPIKREGMDP